MKKQTLYLGGNKDYTENGPLGEWYWGKSSTDAEGYVELCDGRSGNSHDSAWSNGHDDAVWRPHSVGDAATPCHSYEPHHPTMLSAPTYLPNSATHTHTHTRAHAHTHTRVRHYHDVDMLQLTPTIPITHPRTSAR